MELNNDKKAILAVSFGTSRPEGMKSIESMEDEFASAFCGYEIRRAFTSPTIRRILEKRSIYADSLPEALDKLSLEGFSKVLLQPTYIIEGFEYDDMVRTAGEYSNRFKELRCGHALLWTEADFDSIARAVTSDICCPEDTACIFMGHGTEHRSDTVYDKLETALNRISPRFFVATVEGQRTINTVCPELSAAGISRVQLHPLTLTAGVHAAEDMAGEAPDSWKSILQSHGFHVDCIIHGLGEKEAVRGIFTDHLRELIQ